MLILFERANYLGVRWRSGEEVDCVEGWGDQITSAQAFAVIEFQQQERSLTKEVVWILVLLIYQSSQFVNININSLALQILA